MSISLSSPKPLLSPTTAGIEGSKYAHVLYVDTPKYTAPMAQPHSSTSSLHSTSSSHSTTSAPSSYTSTHSIQMPKYADDHYPLIHTINPELIPSHTPKDHSAIYCARMMAQIHNMIIRALNSSYNHCLTITPDTQEATDFLHFNKILCATLDDDDDDHHHHTEEEFLFPDIEKLMGKDGGMEDNVDGHEKFMAAFQLLSTYVNNTSPAEYDGLAMRNLIEASAPDLIQHLHDEIPTFTKLHVLNSKELRKAWDVTAHEATKDQDLSVDAPFVLGYLDNEFKVDAKENESPGILWVAVVAAVDKWFARKFRGVWRFCPSDLRGNRKLLGSL